MPTLRRLLSRLRDLLHRLIVLLLPLVPKAIVGRVASRYIAGETLDDAVRVVRELNQRGFAGTIDVLGEDVTAPEQADAAVATYLEVLDRIHAEGLRTGVSLKLTQLGLRLDQDRCLGNLMRIVHAAAERGIFVRVDMEDSSLTDRTLRIVEAARRESPKVGAVLQAYLHRTPDDAERLIAEGCTIRLCKGIYREPPEIAWQDRQKVRDVFVGVARRFLQSEVYIGLATHDIALLETLRAEIRTQGVPNDRYEFQALLGVPITATLDQLVAEGHRVRLYVPFGSHWYPYSVRRLKENPQMAGHVLSALFRRDRGLLRPHEPATTEPASDSPTRW
ncbi:MAG: proline dehydrogenase [Myxococcales bacterium]